MGVADDSVYATAVNIYEQRAIDHQRNLELALRLEQAGILPADWPWWPDDPKRECEQSRESETAEKR